jgi:arsenate reductase-like glutaredoxin family protein
MILLFYSEQCILSNKLLEYLNKNNLNEYFKMINIDKINNHEIVNIYATGDILLSGRIYIALPSNVILTNEIKKKYNII